MLVGLRTGHLAQWTDSQQHLKASEKASHSKKTRALQEGEDPGRRRWGNKLPCLDPPATARDHPLNTKPASSPVPRDRRSGRSLCGRLGGVVS